MDLVRHVSSGSAATSERPAPLPEWLVTNGLGGYASGTTSGVVTRRYHGLLIAALPAPLGRWLVFSHLSDRVRLPSGDVWDLSHPRRRDTAAFDVQFRLELGLPVWRYEGGGVVIEKRIILPHQQNSCYVIYELIEGTGPVRLKLLPSVHSRSHDAPVNAPLPGPFTISEAGGRYEIAAVDHPALRLLLHGPRQAFTVERQELPEIIYPAEEERGYEHRGTLWSPGYFRADLVAGRATALVASTEAWDTVAAIEPADALRIEQDRRVRLVAAAAPAAQQGLGAELVLAADQFVIRPVSRTGEATRAQAE